MPRALRVTTACLLAAIVLGTAPAAALDGDDQAVTIGGGAEIEVPEDGDGSSLVAADVEAAAGTIRVLGRGFGHGRGLGQYGAYGYARMGWTSARILDHFFGNTRAGSVGNETIRVRLLKHDDTVDDGKIFRSPEADLTVGDLTVPAGDARPYVRITWQGSQAYAQRGTYCFGDWTDPEPVASVVGGSGGYRYVEVSAASAPGDDPDRMVSVCEWSGGSLSDIVAYRGTLWAGLDPDAGNLDERTFVVNEVKLEDYVRGVVPYESIAGWGQSGGQAALEAQAVSARSYAVAYSARRWAPGDICDTTSCQVYGGAWKYFSSRGDHRGSAVYAARATASTAGVVRVWASGSRAGSVVSTEYSSSTGGWTATVQEGNRFGPVEDVGDEILGDNQVWERTVSLSAIADRWSGLGEVESIVVTARNGLGTWGGRVQGIRIVGTEGTVNRSWSQWSQDEFRRAFGLRSDWYCFPDFEDCGADAIPPQPTNTGHGFWIVRPNGAVGAFGDAAHAGDADELPLNRPVVGLATHPSGEGYWLLGADGGIFSYGRAPFYGSTGSLVLNEPVVAMAAHPSGRGYWFVASDGGIFSYGAAEFHGSMGGIPLVSPIVGMATTPTGKGYWMVAADGGVFAFGDARFHGSIGGEVRNDPVVGMAPYQGGQGYWIVTASGEVHAFGAARHRGDASAIDLPSPIAGMAVPEDGEGYWLIRSDGLSYTYGGLTDFPSSAFGGPIVGIASIP